LATYTIIANSVLSRYTRVAAVARYINEDRGRERERIIKKRGKGGAKE
jgi:hypothetical protein